MQKKLTTEIVDRSRELAKKFIEFNNQAISPYHAIHKLEERLVGAGFKRLIETDVWELQNGEFYYIKRGSNSSIVAFGIPTKGLDPAISGFKILGAHSDSPCIRLAPKFETSNSGFEQVYIQTYGGGIWHTWVDRDLVLGGRVVIKTEKGLEVRLYHSKKPIAKIPTLAIHLTKDRENVKFNKETELRPIIATELMKNFMKNEQSPASLLKGMISAELNCKEEDILDFDLCFADAQDSSIIGINDEFLSGPRLDNLYTSFCSIESIVQLKQNPDVFNHLNDVNIVAIFDHEEIGSQTYVGADSEFMHSVCCAIADATHKEKQSDIGIMLRRSLLISADMAHSIHPNYSGIHQSNHHPKINGGVVLKINPNGRYTSDAISGAMAKHIAKTFDVPLTEFIVRQDSPCGSTIGPMLASKLGCLAMDIGAPQWSMHSCRETAGVLDFYHYTQFMKGCFESNLDMLIPKNL